MNFKDLLLRAKDGDQQAKEEIFLMYRPLLFKESCVNGIFDEDLFQELTLETPGASTITSIQSLVI